MCLMSKIWHAKEHCNHCNILLVYYIISITSKRSQDNLFGWFFYSVVRLVVTVFPQKFVFVKPDSTVLLVEANVRVSMVFAMEV